jgi:hypothetical protein
VRSKHRYRLRKSMNSPDRDAYGNLPHLQHPEATRRNDTAPAWFRADARVVPSRQRCLANSGVHSGTAFRDDPRSRQANTGNPTEDTTRPLRTGALLIIALDDEPGYDLPVYKAGLCPSGRIASINHETYYLWIILHFDFSYFYEFSAISA